MHLIVRHTALAVSVDAEDAVEKVEEIPDKFSDAVFAVTYMVAHLADDSRASVAPAVVIIVGMPCSRYGIAAYRAHRAADTGRLVHAEVMVARGGSLRRIFIRQHKISELRRKISRAAVTDRDIYIREAAGVNSGQVKGE